MGGQNNKWSELQYMVDPNQEVAGITEAAVITRVVGTTGVPGPQEWLGPQGWLRT
jgi:hypothetical protein